MQINPLKTPTVARSAARPQSQDAPPPQESDTFDRVFHPTGVALTGAGACFGGLSALKLAAALPAEFQTAAGIAGALVGGAVGLGLGIPAGKAMQEAVSNPSLANSAKSGAWMGGALGLMGAAAMLTGTGFATPAVADLALIVGGGAGLGGAAASLVHGQNVLRDKVLS